MFHHRQHRTNLYEDRSDPQLRLARASHRSIGHGNDYDTKTSPVMMSIRTRRLPTVKGKRGTAWSKALNSYVNDLSGTIGHWVTNATPSS